MKLNIPLIMKFLHFALSLSLLSLYVHSSLSNTCLVFHLCAVPSICPISAAKAIYSRSHLPDFQAYMRIAIVFVYICTIRVWLPSCSARLLSLSVSLVQMHLQIRGRKEFNLILWLVYMLCAMYVYYIHII